MTLIRKQVVWCINEMHLTHAHGLIIITQCKHIGNGEVTNREQGLKPLSHMCMLMYGYVAISNAHQVRTTSTKALTQLMRGIIASSLKNARRSFDTPCAYIYVTWYGLRALVMDQEQPTKCFATLQKLRVWLCLSPPPPINSLLNVRRR